MVRSFVVVAIIALGCGGKTRAPLTATWSAPPLLAHIPDDSPYVIASLEPPNQTPSTMLAGLEARMAESLAILYELSDEEREALDPWMRALLVVLDELRGKPAAKWWSALGLSEDPKFVLYGLSIWPVARMEIGDPVKLRSVIERAARAAKLPGSAHRTGSGTYWVFETGFAVIVVAIDDRRRQLVVAALPGRAVPDALPHLLGDALPEHSLATTRRVPDLLAKHGFPRLVFGYVDTRLALAALTRTPTAFDRQWRDALGPVSPSCRVDLELLTRAFPLVIGGYRKLDATTFDMSIAVEVPTHVTTALAKMRTTVPPLPVSKQRPLFAVGAAVDVDALLAWAAGHARTWLARPEKCEWLAGMDAAIAQLEQVFSAPPDMVRGIRGLALVVDDFTGGPENMSGEALFIGDRVHELPKLLGGLIPPIANVPLTANSPPISIPTRALGLPFSSAHLGARAGRLALAVGRGSEHRVVDRLAAPSILAPILAFESDMARLEEVLEKVSSKQREPRPKRIDDISMRLELRDGVLDFVATGLWATASDP